MATYYVRMIGDDSNDGLSPATAWRTFGKVFGTTGISSSDTVYFGAGVYRERVFVTMISATSETQIIGDVEGKYTGDPGEVQLTPFDINDETLPTNLASSVLILNGRDNLTFRNITFIAHPNAPVFDAQTPTSLYIKIIGCAFNSININSENRRVIDVSATTPVYWLIDKCMFTSSRSSNTIRITIGRQNVSDYNASFIISNCSFVGGGTNAIQVIESGSGAFCGGGVYITNCYVHGYTNGFQLSGTLIAGSMMQFPVLVRNCIILCSNTAFSSSRVGGLVEDYNLIVALTPRVNTRIGPHSITDFSVVPLLYFGQEQIWGDNKALGQPTRKSPLLSHGDASISFDFDIANNPKLAGNIVTFHTGLATSASNGLLVDSNKNFGNGTLNGYCVKITAGVGAGQTKLIDTSSGSNIYVDGDWPVAPNSTSSYMVFQGPTSHVGVTSSGSGNILVDNDATWGPQFWQGYTCRLTSGPNAGSSFAISGNSSRALSGFFNTLATPGDSYELFWGSIYSGRVSSANSSGITDNTASWSNMFWANYLCVITSGTASGSQAYISGNSSTVLSGVSTFAITPISGDSYVLYQATGNLSGLVNGYVPPYGRNVIHSNLGCYEGPNRAYRETGFSYSGQNSIRLTSYNFQDFRVAASGATTLNVHGFYDSIYNGPPPSLIINDGAYIGVDDVTGSMSGGANQWETLSLSVTPTIPGILKVRVKSNSTGIGGFCYFDSFSVT
jgi:hypothetical protein